MSHTTNDDGRVPTAIPAEQDLLGSLISGAATLADLPGFQSDWFSDPIHTCIYQAIEAQAARGSPCDVASLSSILAPCSETTDGPEPDSVLEEVGGAGYLADLDGRSVPEIAVSARKVRGAWLCRQLIDLGQSLVSSAFGGRFTEALNMAMWRVSDLSAVVG